MKRKVSRQKPPTLFDLPIDGGEPPPPPAETAEPPPPEGSQPLFEMEETPAAEAPPTETDVLEPTVPAGARPGSVLAAGLFDFMAVFAVLTIALVGSVLMGVDLTSALFGPLAMFGAVFSFLYYVLPLAFWGKTPGMSWAGIVARNDGDQPLTFGQTALRWIAAGITAGLAGMPLLLALTGRSLADRLSGSRTLRRR